MRITWKFFEEKRFPMLVEAATEAGVDTLNWGLVQVHSSGRTLAEVDPDHRGVSEIQSWDTAREADLWVQGALRMYYWNRKNQDKA